MRHPNVPLLEIYIRHMTGAELKVLLMILRWCDDDGYGEFTKKFIAEKAKVSYKTALKAIQVLERWGFVAWTEHGVVMSSEIHQQFYETIDETMDRLERQKWPINFE